MMKPLGCGSWEYQEQREDLPLWLSHRGGGRGTAGFLSLRAQVSSTFVGARTSHPQVQAYQGTPLVHDIVVYMHICVC